jgi:hypothetical protein
MRLIIALIIALFLAWPAAAQQAEDESSTTVQPAIQAPVAEPEKGIIEIYQPLIAAGVALLAAVLAYKGVLRRIERDDKSLKFQLQNERARLAAQLRADRSRQRRQIKAERDRDQQLAWNDAMSLATELRADIQSMIMRLKTADVKAKHIVHFVQANEIDRARNLIKEFDLPKSEIYKTHLCNLGTLRFLDPDIPGKIVSFYQDFVLAEEHVIYMNIFEPTGEAFLGGVQSFQKVIESSAKMSETLQEFLGAAIELEQARRDAK